MVKDRSKGVLSPQFRQGEGHVVELTITSTEGGPLSAGVDLGNLPVPDRRFASDSASLLVDSSLVKLLFAQRHPIGDGLLSMLVINMTFEAIQQFVGSINIDFLENVRKLSTVQQASKLHTFTQKADQTVILTASMVMAGYSGNDGCLDLFYSSPFAVRQVAFFKKISVEPVVRVNLPTGVLIAMLDSLTEAAKMFPSISTLENQK